MGSKMFNFSLKHFRSIFSFDKYLRVTLEMGRAIAQAISRRFPTAAARVRAWVRSCGICGGQSGTGEGFLRVLRFPLPIHIPPIAPQSSSSSIVCVWYKRPDSDRRIKWTQSHPMRKKNARDTNRNGCLDCNYNRNVSKNIIKTPQ
jgi:hypothetical protein